MPAPLTPQEEAQYADAIRRDPAIAAILRDPQYSTPMLRDAAINNYLRNHPDSPARAVMGFEAVNAPDNQGRGRGVYRYDQNAGSGSLKWEGLEPAHWYTDPGFWAPIAATAGILPDIGTSQGLLSAVFGGGGSGYVANSVNGVENSIYGGAGAAGAAGAGGAAGAAGAGGAGTAAKGLANGGGLLNDILTKYVPLGLAGFSAAKGFQTPAANKDLEDVIGMAKNRVTQSEPLFQALNRMAMNGLPNSAK